MVNENGCCSSLRVVEIVEIKNGLLMFVGAKNGIDTRIWVCPKWCTPKTDGFTITINNCYYWTVCR